jgi:uncharacterized membrane protein YfcA
MISSSDAVLLVGAGVLAGIVGTAGGITSLISYPALLATGLPAYPASVANTVAVVACWPGAALASRPELEGRAAWLRKWVWVAAAGGAVGAVLFLATPSDAFDRVVPFLVGAGSLALLCQPRISALGGARLYGSKLVLCAGLLALSAYNGYFGAGAGVMTLALVVLAVDQRMTSANALKNMLVGAASVLSALVFAAFGPVAWTAVLPLGIGMFAGSTIGPRVARGIPAGVLRWIVALIGLGLALKLWIAPT